MLNQTASSPGYTNLQRIRTFEYSNNLTLEKGVKLMDNLKEMVKKKVTLSQLIRHFRIDRNKKYCRCINSAEHSNNDNHYSLAINREDYFKCFSCGIQGDVIEFYMKYKNVDFKTALKYLAETFHIKATESFTPERREVKAVEKIFTMTDWKEDLYNEQNEINENGSLSGDWKEDLYNERHGIYNDIREDSIKSEWDLELYDDRSGKYEFSANMNTKDAKTRALTELKSERLETNKKIFEDLFLFSMEHYSGIDSDILNYLSVVRKIKEEVIDNARIFSLPEVSITKDYLKSKYSDIELQQAGLLNENGNFVFQNNHRLMIPYLSGNAIVYLRSRYFNKKSNDPGNRKYSSLRSISFDLNSPRRFYNSDILNKTNSNEDIYITEGEFDCLSMLSMGFNAIGIPGVSSIPDQVVLEKLLRFDIILCFDNDKAGKELTKKLQSLYLSKYGKKVSIIDLPVGMKDISDFMVDHLTKN